MPPQPDDEHTLPPTRHSNAPRVLVAEHAASSAERLRQRLAASGYEVVTVASLEAVRRRLAAESCDAVLLALALPDCRGPAAVEAAAASAPEAAIVALGQRSDDAQALEAVRAGAQDVVVADELGLASLPSVVARAIERQRSLTEARTRARTSAKLLDEVRSAVIVTDAHGILTSWNRAAEELYGWPRSEALGRSVLDLTVPAGQHDLAAAILAEVERTGRWSGEYDVQRRDGSTVPAWVSLAVSRDDGGSAVGFVGVSHDRSQERSAERERQRLLTDLGERVKELDLLHKTSVALRHDSDDLPGLFQRLVRLLPEAFAHPHLAEAQLRYTHDALRLEAATARYRTTPWLARTSFTTLAGGHGQVTVAYREDPGTASPASAAARFAREEHAVLDSFGDALRAYLDRQRARADLEDRERVRSALLDVYAAFVEGSTERTAARVLDAAFATIPMATTGSVLLRTSTGGYRFVASRGYDHEALRRIELPPDMIVFGRDWRDGRPFVVHGVAELLRDHASAGGDMRALYETTATAGAREALVAPVVVGDALVAAISIEHRAPGISFPPGAPDLLQAFSEGIAALLQRVESEERRGLLARAVDATDDGVAILDYPSPEAASTGAEPLCLEANPACARLLGLSLERVRRWDVGSVVERPSNEPLITALRRALEGAPTAAVEAPLERDDGTIVWLSITITKLSETERRVRLLMTLRDVTARHRHTKQLLRLNAELQLRLAEAKTLEAIDDAIISGRPTEEVLATIVEEVRRHASVAAATVLAADADGTFLRPIASSASEPPYPEGRVPFGRGPAGRAAQLRQTVEVAPGARAAAAFEDDARTLPSVGGGYAAWPLVTQDAVVGVLETFMAPGAAPGDDWRSFMQRIAAQTAIALESGTMVERLRRAAAEYAQLADFSGRIEDIDDPEELVDHGVRTLMSEFGMAAAAYFRRDGDAIEMIRRWGAFPEEQLGVITRRGRVGRGASGLAVTRRESVYVEDYPSWPSAIPALRDGGVQSLLALPISTEGRVDHVITLMSFDRRAPLRREQIAVARAFVRRLERALERLAHLAEIVGTREEAFRALGLALEYRDYETKGHTDRVVALSRRLGRRLRLRDDELEALAWGAYLHDIGKIAIPDAILLKPGRLTPDEFEQVKRHAPFGYHMSRDLPFLPDATREVVRSHHERWDGDGYPDGLTATAIPFLARVFALVDVFDALVSERPYKPAWPLDRALAEIASQAGRQFDPELAHALIALLREDAVGHGPRPDAPPPD